MSLLCCALVVACASNKKIEKIPLDVLFGNPEKTCVRISPDGSTIAYLKPDKHHRLQIWIVKDGQEEQKITDNQHRSITQYFWSYDNQHLLYLQDENGNENWNLYRTNIATCETVNLTPFDNVQVRILAYKKQYPNLIVVGINKDVKSQHDPYKIDLITGEIISLGKSPEDALGLIINNNLEFVGATVSVGDGSTQLLKKDNDDWIIWLQRSHLESFGALQLTKDNRYLYAVDSEDANSNQLVKIDLQNQGNIEVIASDPFYDVQDVLFDLDTYDVLAVSFNRERNEWLALDEAIKKDFDVISKLHKGDLIIVSRNENDTIWIVAFNDDTGPIPYFLYNRSPQKDLIKLHSSAQLLFYNRPHLLDYELQPRNPISFQARDGLTIHGYITYPKGYQSEKVPLVLWVHGGPWIRDSWGYDGVAQWLANRGYAVLQVNYRGSTGYGKDFLNAGNKQWGKKMLDDLVDAVSWANESGYIDSNRVAIFGASYGGYAALCGAAFTQGVFKCAADICGRSNLFSRFNAIPPYWKAYIAMQKHRIGDPDLEPELFKAASPFFHAEKINIPLFIAHGTNDARINPEESEKIVAILKERNVPCQYRAFPDEGHSFIKEKNRLYCFSEIEKFFEQYLK